VNGWNTTGVRPTVRKLGHLPSAEYPCRLSGECRWSVWRKDPFAARARDSVREREFKIFRKQLFDVRPLHIVRLLELSNLQNLVDISIRLANGDNTGHT
jgi:hypothetical protein